MKWKLIRESEEGKKAKYKVGDIVYTPWCKPVTITRVSFPFGEKPWYDYDIEQFGSLYKGFEPETFFYDNDDPDDPRRVKYLNDLKGSTIDPDDFKDIAPF